ncbi:hypothetical protein [Haloferula sp.]|uniref:hypothetical protein n=1 Tax=Haloferula sp. TaxID=2497595 RepID=UPI003C72D3D8
MTADLNQELRVAVASGRSMALEAGSSAHQPASPEVEAKLSRLLTVTIGMFATAMTSIIVVGITFF